MAGTRPDLLDGDLPCVLVTAGDSAPCRWPNAGPVRVPAPVGVEGGALHIEGEHWRLIGLEIIHGPYGVFGVDTGDNLFDRLVTRDNYESGFHLQGASSDNQILNPGSAQER